MPYLWSSVRCGRISVKLLMPWRAKLYGNYPGSKFRGSRFKVILMKIERIEDIEAWQLARELTRKVYRLAQKFREPGTVNLTT
jgi:hypothetical protein